MAQNRLRLIDIANEDLAMLCERIATAYSCDTSAVDGAVFARLAQLLLAAEIQPGGPYKDKSGEPTLELNANIGRLFLLLKKPLPNIDKYLAQSSNKKLTRSEQEALVKYNETKIRNSEATHEASSPLAYRRVQKTLETLAEPVRTQTLHFLARVKAADSTSEIAEIAHFTSETLGANVSASTIAKLSEANIYSWIAYTIYDHILDKDADASLLPAANICMRLAINNYRKSLPARHPLQALITEYFDQVDTASAWELITCRFAISDNAITVSELPNYKKYESLAQRSCIHILGPLIVASKVLGGDEMDAMTKGLRHYLIARQLSDDIHDWREDLAAGIITPVVALLLARQHISSGSMCNLDKLTEAMQEDFLNGSARLVSQLILEQTRQAQSHLIASGCKPHSSVCALVLRLESMAKSSIHQQIRFLGFKENYRTPQ